MNPNFGDNPNIRPTILAEGYEFTGEFRNVERGELFFPTGYTRRTSVTPYTAEGTFTHVPGPRWIVRPVPEKIVTVTTTTTGARFPFPVELTFVPPTKQPLLLTVEEAEELADDLTQEVESIKDARRGPYVQVGYGPNGRGPLYTYRDPSGTLQVGDLVEVPVTYGTKVGTVASLDRGSWNGEVKTVAARLIRQELAA